MGRRWWELKVDAYSRIIEALSSIVYYYEVEHDAALEGRELPGEKRIEIANHWKRGHAEEKKGQANHASSGLAEVSDCLGNGRVEISKLRAVGLLLPRGFHNPVPIDTLSALGKR